MMDKNVNSKYEENFTRGGKDVASLLKRIQSKLDSIEEKIDSLIQKSRQKTFEGKCSSRPYKKYDKTTSLRKGIYGEKKEESSNEGKFYHGRPFGKKKESRKGNFKRDKKPFKKSSK